MDAHAGDLDAGVSFYLEGGGVGHGLEAYPSHEDLTADPGARGGHPEAVSGAWKSLRVRAGAACTQGAPAVWAPVSPAAWVRGRGRGSLLPCAGRAPPDRLRVSLDALQAPFPGGDASDDDEDWHAARSQGSPGEPDDDVQLLSSTVIPATRTRARPAPRGAEPAPRRGAAPRTTRAARPVIDDETSEEDLGKHSLQGRDRPGWWSACGTAMGFGGGGEIPSLLPPPAAGAGFDALA